MTEPIQIDHPKFKQIPAPVKPLLRPMLFAAIGLHALLLFLPLPSEQRPKAKDSKKEQDPVKITQLSKSAPQARPKIARPAVPKVANRPAPTVQVPATPKSATPASAQPAAQAKDPFADFPHFQPSTPDCFGRGLGDNCRIASADLAAVVYYFQKALPGKKYAIALEEETPGRKIFQITKGDRQGYLSILSDAPTTVYVLAEQKVNSLSDLKGAVIVPPELYQLLADLVPPADPNDPSATNTARREDFAQPDFFFKPSADPDAAPEGLPGLDGSPSVIPGQTPASFYQTSLDQPLRSIFEEVAPAGTYANGSLYRLKKGSATVYLSLVTARNGTATIVSVWLRDPR